MSAPESISATEERIIRSDGGDSRFAARAVFALAAALFVAMRLWRLTADCLWFDEIFSLHAARHAWRDLLAFVAADVIHPPLFYLLLKLWVALGGESLWWVRLFPALTASAALIPFYLLCRELRLRAAEMNLALVLMAASGYLIHYAQTLRMYSLLLLLSLASLWLCARFVNAARQGKRERKRSGLLFLFVINLLLIYTHYYGWVVVGCEFLYLLIWQRRRLVPFSLSTAALLLCFSPWAYAVTQAAARGASVGQNIGWAARPDALMLARYFITLNEPFIFREGALLSLRAVIFLFALVFLLFGLPVAALLWRSIRGGTEENYQPVAPVKFLALIAFLPVLLAFILSQLLPHSVWGTRHLIIVAVPYLMLAAIALCRLRPAWAQTALLIALACWILLAGVFIAIRKPPVGIWCAWEPLARRMQAIEAAQAGGVRVYAFEDLIAYHLWFALDVAGDQRFSIAVVKNVPGVAEDPAYFLPRRFTGITTTDLNSIEGEQFWIAFRDVSWNEERPPLSLLRERGYRVGERLEYAAGGQRAFLIFAHRQ